MCCVCVVTEPYEPWKKGPWLVRGFLGDEIYLPSYMGIVKKNTSLLSNRYFMESIWGFCFVAHMDVSENTRLGACLRGTGRRAAACLAEIEGRRSQQRSAEICQKTGRFGIRRRGHWITHFRGGGSPTITDSCISPIFKDFPYLICIVWVGVPWWPLEWSTIIVHAFVFIEWLLWMSGVHPIRWKHCRPD